MSIKLNRTVLLVDDEADVRAYLSVALLEAGFEVDMAADGNEALSRIKERRPDLISLDLVMPGKSGVMFHRELMKNKDWAKIPVLIVTGHARDEIGRADLKELTMSGRGIYLEKPVKPENYIAAIKKILGLDISERERETAEMVEMQNELKNLIDKADPETLKRIGQMLHDRKSE
jgi:DNA-binding response OmpR family regulator